MPDSSTLILAIETSNPGPAGHGGVALGHFLPGGRIEHVAHRRLAPTSRHDDGLMPAIDELVKAAGAVPASISTIAVSIGPGGYTSLRIAVSTARLLAESIGARCIAVPTDEAVVLGIEPAIPPGRPVVITLAWKRDSVWARSYGWNNARPEPATPGQVVTLPRLADLIPDGPAHIVADDELCAMLKSQAIWRSEWTSSPPRFDPRAVLQAAVGRPAIDPLKLLPVYAREPEAVTKWRELHG